MPAKSPAVKTVGMSFGSRMSPPHHSVLPLEPPQGNCEPRLSWGGVALLADCMLNAGLQLEKGHFPGSGAPMGPQLSQASQSYPNTRDMKDCSRRSFGPCGVRLPNQLVLPSLGTLRLLPVQKSDGYVEPTKTSYRNPLAEPGCRGSASHPNLAPS